MRRQFVVELLSKLTRNGCSTTLKSSLNRFHHRSLSEYPTVSRSSLWKACSRNGVSVTLQNGFVSRRFFSEALLQGRGKFPLIISKARSSRSFTSPDPGRRSIFRRFTTDGVVLGLVLTNVAVFMLWRFADTEFMKKNFMISVDNFTNGRLHTLITCAFSHNKPSHVVSNMIGLYFFGTSIGRVFGAQYLLKLYLSGAVVGSISFLAYHGYMAHSSEINQSHSAVLGLGASGAVNAIMLLDIFLFPTKTVYFDLLIPMPAILLGFFIIGQDILRVWEGDGQISASAHLGGATVAVFAWLRKRKGRFGRF